VRAFLLETISQTGGHLASNLGAVELTLALHYCFNSPRDRFIWDVGHQAYTHKIITGRRDLFHTQRQLGATTPLALATPRPPSRPDWEWR